MDQNNSSSRRFEPYNVNWCRRKRFPTANLTRLLAERQIGVRKEGTNFTKGSREFYHCLPIERAEHAVERPQFFPLRFTPDGSKLIAIAPSFQEIYLFNYRGVQFGADCSGKQLFQAIFPKRVSIQFWDPRESQRTQAERLQFGTLSRDCAFVTPDSRFLVVAAAIPVPESRSTFDEVVRNNESLPSDTHLMCTTFYSIDLKKAQLVGSHKFDFDEIHIQNGVYLLEWTLAILSVQHQIIHILGIDKQTGEFIRLKEIGPSVLDDDPLWDAGLADPRGKFFTAFRQRFLTHLYKQHAAKGQTSHFLYEIEFFNSLKMQKIQFVGPELILIRMDLHPRHTDTHSGHTFMFVLFEWRHGNIAGVYDRCSAQLFELFEKFNESFKNGHLPANLFPNSMEHCGHVRAVHDNLKESSLASLTPEDMRRRVLATLPVPNSQHLVGTPYLDPTLFSFDERLVGLLEKGRYPLEQPLKLFSRRTKQLHTRMEFHADSARVYPSCYARVLFHPTDPFVISISRGTQPETMISFYMPKAADKLL